MRCPPTGKLRLICHSPCSRPHAASEAKLRTITPQTLQQSIWSCAIRESPAAAGLGKQSGGKRSDSWTELTVKTLLIYNGKRCSAQSIASALLWCGPEEERVCKHQSFGQMAPGLLSHLHSYSSKSCSSAAGSSASPTFRDSSSPGYPREQLSSQQPWLWMGHDQQQLQRAAIFSCETRTVFQ